MHAGPTVRQNKTQQHSRPALFFLTSKRSPCPARRVRSLSVLTVVEKLDELGALQTLVVVH